MDSDTKVAFDSMHAAFDSMHAAFGKLNVSFNNLVRLVEDMSQSLQVEMQGLSAGLDRLEAATRRNTTMLSGGTAALVALHRWAEDRDKLDSRRDREIRDIRVRLQKVERAVKRRAS